MVFAHRPYHLNSKMLKKQNKFCFLKHQNKHQLLTIVGSLISWNNTIINNYIIVDNSEGYTVDYTDNVPDTGDQYYKRVIFKVKIMDILFILNHEKPVMLQLSLVNLPIFVPYTTFFLSMIWYNKFIVFVFNIIILSNNLKIGTKD